MRSVTTVAAAQLVQTAKGMVNLVRPATQMETELIELVKALITLVESLLARRM